MSVFFPFFVFGTVQPFLPPVLCAGVTGFGLSGSQSSYESAALMVERKLCMKVCLSYSKIEADFSFDGLLLTVLDIFSLFLFSWLYLKFTLSSCFRIFINV